MTDIVPDHRLRVRSCLPRAFAATVSTVLKLGLCNGDKCAIGVGFVTTGGLAVGWRCLCWGCSLLCPLGTFISTPFSEIILVLLPAVLVLTL